MESRKIVKSGKTSFTISLPISWIRKNRLSPGDILSISEMRQGDLIISQSFKEEKNSLKEIIIDVRGKKETVIASELFAAYFQEVTSIIFKGRDLRFTRQRIEPLINEYLGLDILGESNRGLHVKNFFLLDNETTPQEIIRRMDMINSTCFQTLCSAKKDFSEEDLREIENFHEHNHRLYWLLRKSIKHLSSDLSSQRKFHIFLEDISSSKSFAQAMMNISESLLWIGQIFIFLDLRGEHLRRLQGLIVNAEAEYKRVVKILHKNDKKAACVFVMQHHQIDDNLEKSFIGLDDPLQVQAAASLRWIYLALRSLAEELSVG